MIIAGVLIQTLPGQAGVVSARLGCVDGLVVHGMDGDARVAAVWSAADADDLSRQAESLIKGDPQVVGVFPTFVGQATEDVV
jgi:nitrate reductase NapAB chaperone NapD